KPTNLMVTGDGTLKVLDLGIARTLAGDRTHITSTIGPGTRGYMSPEQLRRVSPPEKDGSIPRDVNEDDRGSTDMVGPASDGYSLGQTVYELLTGRPLYGQRKEDDLSRVEQRKLDGEPLPSLRALGIRTSPEVDVLLRGGLSRDAADRPADAA